MADPTATPIAELALARRLERCEGMAGAACVDARRRIQPESGACWTEIAGTLAMFDTVGSPLNQSFGLGTDQIPDEDDLARLESFFFSRGANAEHEICHLIDPEFLRRLGELGYQPFEWSDVLIQPLALDKYPGGTNGEGLRTRLIESDEQESWARLAADGWSQEKDVAELMFEFSRIGAAREGSLCFLAELDGRPIATGGLFIHDGVALLAGASTVPQWRRRGAQRALLTARLSFACQQRCDLAMMVAQPGSTSHRNAQQSEFRVAYARTKWRRLPPSRSFQTPLNL
jgi:hypothetical protein